MATTIPAEFNDLLESKALANIATIGPKGEPQNNPVWFIWDGKNILFSQVKTRQKFRNLQRDPRVAVTIIDPTNPGRYLEVRGNVVRFEDDLERKFADETAIKYTGQTFQFHQPGEERFTIVVEPEKVLTRG